VAQQLIPTPDGKARRACIEVLLNTPLVSDHIRKGEMPFAQGADEKVTRSGHADL
jgi:twitching motility protein PilU